ncbi:type II toxin-antitoxin system Phd/YefM family antitoxin [Tessaracoccus sp. G1721]
MSTVASRDLRNHTRSVLDRVAAGDVVTVTVNGEPVAEIRSPARRRPAAMTRSGVIDLVHAQRVDATLEADLGWISAGSTEDLGPIR